MLSRLTRWFTQCLRTTRTIRHLTLHGAGLHHGSVLLLESLVETGRALEVLVDATHDAGLFAVDEGLGGEVVDTVVEAALDHLGVHLKETRLDKCIGMVRLSDGHGSDSK